MYYILPISFICGYSLGYYKLVDKWIKISQNIKKINDSKRLCCNRDSLNDSTVNKNDKPLPKYENHYITGLKTLFEAICVTGYQKLNKSVKKIDKKTYEITYKINNKFYKFRQIVKRGPCPFTKIVDENDRDITDIIKLYAGPCYNFHNQSITPKYFDCKRIMICYNNDSKIIFREDDEIII